jgi:hypothetical protein
MILHTYDILVESRSGDVNTPILLRPIGDIQWFGFDDDVAINTAAKHMKWGIENNAYFIGMGDYVDTLSPSNRDRLKQAALYDSAEMFLDMSIEKLIDNLYERVFVGSEGRWLGLLEGHHYYKFEDGTTTDQRLCKFVGGKFLGTSAIIRLRFKTGEGNYGNINIWCHHGVGSGKRLSAPINQLELLPTYWPECQIFLIGHHHKKIGGPINQTIPIWPHSDSKQEPRLLHRTCIVACTGGFLKGYIEGRERGNYVEKAMLPPVAIGGITIKIVPHWSRKGGSSIWNPLITVEQ